VANGDLAASVGMDTVSGAEDINDGWDEDNLTRDYIAQHRLTGTHSASQITSGTLPVARGGTGRNNLYGTPGDGYSPHPTNWRLLIVDPENTVRVATEDIAPQYLGYQVHFAVLEGVDFNDGEAVEAHGAPFTPTYITTQALLTTTSGIVVVTPRADNEPANDTNVFLRAHNAAGAYDGTVSKIMLLAMRAA
jgi:hypothetical protein